MTNSTIVPSQGSSTKQTITRLRPGALSPGGKGVEIKHGSYERYLNKKKRELKEGKVCNACTSYERYIKKNT